MIRMSLLKSNFGFFLGMVVLAFLITPIMTVNASPKTDFEIVAATPKDRIALMGTTERIKITVYNQGDISDDYAFSLSVSTSRGAKEKWPAEIQDSTLEGVEPGGYRETFLSVTVPKNVVDFSQNEVKVLCTNSRGKTDSETVIIGAGPPASYNKEYLATGVAVVVAGIAIVLARWRGFL